MYNRYLNGDDFIYLEDEPRERPPQSPAHTSRTSRTTENDLAGEVVGGFTKLLDGVLKRFSLEKLDAGDILLVLIILFLYLEGDDLELVITLGLLLLLGLEDSGQDEATSKGA